MKEKDFRDEVLRAPMPTLKLTRQQRTAIHNPRFLGCEAVNPRFGKRRKRWTEVVTVNAGYE